MNEHALVIHILAVIDYLISRIFYIGFQIVSIHLITLGSGNAATSLTSVAGGQTGCKQRHYKDEPHACSPKVKPKHLDSPLMAGCSIGHNPCLLRVSGCDTAQTKMYTLNHFFTKIVIVILGCFYDNYVCLGVHGSNKFGLSSSIFDS